MTLSECRPLLYHNAMEELGRTPPTRAPEGVDFEIAMEHAGEWLDAVFVKTIEKKQISERVEDANESLLPADSFPTDEQIFGYEAAFRSLIASSIRTRERKGR